MCWFSNLGGTPRRFTVLAIRPLCTLLVSFSQYTPFSWTRLLQRDLPLRPTTMDLPRRRSRACLKSLHNAAMPCKRSSLQPSAWDRPAIDVKKERRNATQMQWPVNRVARRICDVSPPTASQVKQEKEANQTGLKMSYFI
jgi:hypothetical protein